MFELLTFLKSEYNISVEIFYVESKLQFTIAFDFLWEWAFQWILIIIVIEAFHSDWDMMEIIDTYKQWLFARNKHLLRKFML